MTRCAARSRVVHGSIQQSHFHFLVEASSKRALTRAIQSLTISLSKALTGGVGKVFPERYHAVQIRTARQARNRLAYVLNNRRGHPPDPACPGTGDAPGARGAGPAATGNMGPAGA